MCKTRYAQHTSLEWKKYKKSISIPESKSFVYKGACYWITIFKPKLLYMHTLYSIISSVHPYGGTRKNFAFTITLENTGGVYTTFE